MPDSDFMYLLYFTDQDIEANRHRSLSEDQRRRLYGLLCELGLGCIVGGAAVAALIVAALTSYVLTPEQPGHIVGSLVGVAIGISIGVGIGTFKWQQMKQDFDTRIVNIATGRAKLKTSSGKAWRYNLTIATLDFAISRSLYSALASGEHYSVYYTPKSKIILSIERANHNI